MDVLLAVVLVIAVVSAIGHGIWLVVAWAFRGFKSKNAKELTPTIQDDRLATARYLIHLQTRGLISEEQRLRLMLATSKDVEGHSSAVPPPVVAPESATPVGVALDTIRALREQQAEKSGDSIAEASLLSIETPDRQDAVQADHDVGRDVPAEESFQKDDEAAPVQHRVPIAPMPRPEPPEPRRPFSAVLASFMAEKNIRWGEIVGGLLIVSCSTALVISLWSQIEAIPILKFLIFSGMTAAVSGAGLFIYHRWKLPTTGHALLVISTLLVPLNLLAFAAFTKPGDWGNVWVLGPEIAATLVFAWLSFLAGRVVMPRMPALFAMGVVSIGASTLLIRYAAPVTNMMMIAAVRPVPAGLYLLIMGISFRRWSREQNVDETHARRILLQLGVQSFAGLVAIGFLIYQGGEIQSALRDVAPLLCTMAAPGLLIGLHLWREYSGPIATGERVIAAMTALLAASVLLACSVLAWPVPSRLIPVLFINGAAMAALARLARHPAFHALTATWLAAGVVMLVQLALGRITWSMLDSTALLNAVNSVQSGAALVPVVLLGFGVAVWFERRHQRTLAVTYQMTSIALMAISVALVTIHGFARIGDPAHVSWVYLIYAAISLVVAGPRRSPLLTWCSQIMIAFGAGQWLVYTVSIDQFAWPTTLLAVGSLSVAGIIGLQVSARGRHYRKLVFIEPMVHFALLVSLISLIWLFSPYSTGAFAAVGPRVAWAASLWILIAFVIASPALLAAAQAAFFVAAGFAVQNYIHGQSWFPDAGMLNPWAWQLHAGAVGGACLVWSLIRIGVNRFTPAGATQTNSADETKLPGEQASLAQPGESRITRLVSRLLNPPFPPVDHIAGVALLLCGVAMAVWALFPAMMTEHGVAIASVITAIHSRAAEWGSWAVLILLTAVLLARWSEGGRHGAIFGAIVCLWAVSALVAARFESVHRASFAWRWICALICFAASIVACGRPAIAAAIRTPNQPSRDSVPSLLGRSRWLVILLFALPVIAQTAQSAYAVATGSGILALPSTDVGIRLWLLGPVLMIAASFIAYSLACNRSGYAVVAGFLACAAVTCTEETLRIRTGLTTYPDVVWLVQLNAIVFAGVILVCNFLRQVRSPISSATSTLPLWPLYVFRSANSVVLVLSAAAIALSPVTLAPIVNQVGSVWSVLAIVLTESAIHLADRRNIASYAGRNTLWLLFAVVLLASGVSSMGWDNGGWQTYHTLMIGLGLSGILRLVVGRYEVRAYIGAGWQEAVSAASSTDDVIVHDLTCDSCGYNLRSLGRGGKCPECSTSVTASRSAALDRLTPEWSARLVRLRSTIGAMVQACILLGTFLAIRGTIDDPQRPWWSAGLCVAMCATAAGAAVWQPRRATAFVAAIELCAAASLVWVHFHGSALPPLAADGLPDLACVNLAALAAMGVIWIWVERKFLRPKLLAAGDRKPFALHQFAAMTGLVVLAVITVGALATAITSQSIVNVTPAVWTAWSAVAFLLLACVILDELDHALAGLYSLGLAGLVLATAQFHVAPKSLSWILSLELSMYSILTVAIWRWGTIRSTNSKIVRVAGAWLSLSHLTLTLVSCVLATYVCLTNPQFGIRVLTALVPFICAAGMFTFAYGESAKHWTVLGLQAIGLGVILLTWSLLPPDVAAGVFQRAMLVVISKTCMILLAAVLTALLGSTRPFRAALRPAAVVFAVVGAAGMGVVTFENVRGVMQHAVMHVEPAIRVAMLAAIALLVVALVFFALRDRFDPWQSPVAYRGTYMYAAEVMATLLGFHIRATMPWLFTGIITQYWPVLVMGLAFLAMFAGELLERKGLPVLARPLGRTGLFLPALALLEIFLAASSVHYTIILLTAGTFYAVVASLRRSPFFGLVASFLFTGALWYWLHHTGTLDITRHPQLWFIPPALAVLAAGHLSRSQLSEVQRKAINYGGLIAIYVSSTADIFLIGVADAPWLPLVLGGLSVAGILVGIGFRMLSFLQLGTGFLCVSLLTIVWHAAADLGWTWVWYVAGIGLGALIITLFALFEKKRTEMTAVLRDVREWQG